MTGSGLGSFSAPNSYWQLSRAPRYSLLFALPLLVFYQVLAVLLMHGTRSVRNGADVILQSLFVAIAGSWGPLLFMVCLIGAGIYEELLFRVLLVGALAAAARALLGWRPVPAGVAATLVGAAIFSAFHYIGPYGDRLQLYSFVFRMVAGLFFSALYLARGFGITAWTHALYDVALLLVQ